MVYREINLIKVIALLLVFAVTFAGNIFGPKVYKAKICADTVSIDYEIFVPCTLKIINGDGRGRNCVASGSIYWDETEIVQPDEMNQTVDRISKLINLNSKNVLRINFLGDSTSYLTITILGPKFKRIKEITNQFERSNWIFDFTEDIDGVLFYRYRRNTNTLEYINESGEVVYSHYLGNSTPPQNYYLAGVSQNGKYFAKGQRYFDTIPYLDTSRDRFADLAITNYQGKVLWKADSVFNHAYISNDGKSIYTICPGAWGCGNPEIIHYGKRINDSLFFDPGFSGALTPDLSTYVQGTSNRIVAWGLDGKKKWEIPIPGRHPYHGLFDKTAWCSADGKYYLFSTLPHKKGVDVRTFLINSQGEIINSYGLCAHSASFSKDGSYFAIIARGNWVYTTEFPGNRVYFGDVNETKLLWSKEPDNPSENDFQYVFVSPQGKSILTIEYPIRSKATAKPFIIRTFDKNGQLLCKRIVHNVETVRYGGDIETFARYRADGKYLLINQNDLLTIYQLED